MLLLQRRQPLKNLHHALCIFARKVRVVDVVLLRLYSSSKKARLDPTTACGVRLLGWAVEGCQTSSWSGLSRGTLFSMSWRLVYRRFSQLSPLVVCMIFAIQAVTRCFLLPMPDLAELPVALTKFDSPRM